MKRGFLILLVIVFHNTFAKDKFNEVQKLAVTAKIWGFFKYYHPAVANGTVNWDNKLFALLPIIEKTQTQEEFSEAIEKLIADLGEIEVYQEKNKAKNIKYFDKNFSLNWIDQNDMISKSLGKKLRFIEKNRWRGQQYYYNSDPFVKVTNEIKYNEFDWTNKQLRLLALFRYWNQIEYFFPYKYQMDQKWDDVLTEMLPRFMYPTSEKDFVLAMREISIKLNDSHSSTQTGKFYDYFGDKFAPFDIKIIEEKAVVIKLKNDSLAILNNIQLGDVIIKVNDKSINDIINENRKFVEGSNENAVLRNIYWTIFNGKSDSIKIQFLRDDIKSEKFIKRYNYYDLKIKFSEKKKWKLLTNDIGYIDIEKLKVSEIPEVMQEFKNLKTIIFDARRYPQEANIEETLTNYLYPEPKAYAKFIDPDVTYPGRFIWRKNQVGGEKSLGLFKGKIVILENEWTQSHGEHVVMSLKGAPRSTIVGSQTAGADGAVCKYEIIKGYFTQYTAYGVFYPNQNETQRTGIKPDIFVEPTIKGIQEGRDEILENALDYLNNRK
ncbi:C-terminal processing protease CtpA/Prc, contains a PDZ domain [Flavobacterium aquidurense]|uniref:Tail specific protease domain-containing protein n=1 Tax=Flavobacterium frigidimaris TaxID=262320 RepID=A0ABX4BLY2_FLAFR|nr:S41 family peptidase [Flavobacterium frigidimaris]OXA76536.1 hypothetical protein B0A65_18665 [Flavobacterium frigidimaris]SDZ66880.1 C-terminal processing protease CtpA/Prc, contains a PDZ domain [Flavobacterium aquidurense]